MSYKLSPSDKKKIKQAEAKIKKGGALIDGKLIATSSGDKYSKSVIQAIIFLTEKHDYQTT